MSDAVNFGLALALGGVSMFVVMKALDKSKQDTTKQQPPSQPSPPAGPTTPATAEPCAKCALQTRDAVVSLDEDADADTSDSPLPFMNTLTLPDPDADDHHGSESDWDPEHDDRAHEFSVDADLMEMQNVPRNDRNSYSDFLKSQPWSNQWQSQKHASQHQRDQHDKDCDEEGSAAPLPYPTKMGDLLSVELGDHNAARYVFKRALIAFPLDAPVTITKSYGQIKAKPADYIIAEVDVDNGKINVYTMDKGRFERQHEKVLGEDFQYRSTKGLRAVRIPEDCPFTFRIKSARGIEEKGKPGDYVLQVDGPQGQSDQWISSAKNFACMYEPQELAMRRGGDDAVTLYTMVASAWTKFTHSIQRQDVKLQPLEAYSDLLDLADTWDFDVFALRNRSQNHPLVFLGLKIFRQYNFLETFGIAEATLVQFLLQVERCYPANPYHNSMHAADVLQAVHTFLTHGPKFVVSKLSCLQKLCLIVAAAVHDIGHTGTNNSFHCVTKSPLGLIYNDIHVLESFHCATAFHILSLDEFNIFKNIAADDVQTVRKTIIQLVLSTDLADHRTFMTAFKQKLLHHGSSQSSPFSSRPPSQRNSIIRADFDESKQLLLMQLFLKSADISHPCREQAIHLNWSDLILEEFFAQGDKERGFDLACSMNMDRNTTDKVQAQLGFIDFLVTPLFKLLAAVHLALGSSASPPRGFRGKHPSPRGGVSGRDSPSPAPSVIVSPAPSAAVSSSSSPTLSFHPALSSPALSSGRASGASSTNASPNLAAFSHGDLMSRSVHQKCLDNISKNLQYWRNLTDANPSSSA